MNTDNDRLLAALDHFTKARTELGGINLRHYRGRIEIRTAVQEARVAAELGGNATKKALGTPLAESA